MQLRRARPVPRHTEKAHLATVPSFDERFERSARRHRFFPPIVFGQVVELNQVDLVHLHARKRCVDAFGCSLPRAISRLGGQEKLVASFAKDRCEPQLGIAIHRRDVNMVDPKLKQGLNHLVGLWLLHRANCRSPEDDSRARVTRVAEGHGCDAGHGNSLKVGSSDAVYRSRYATRHGRSARATPPSCLRRGWGSRKRFTRE